MLNVKVLCTQKGRDLGDEDEERGCCASGGVDVVNDSFGASGQLRVASRCEPKCFHLRPSPLFFHHNSCDVHNR